MKPVLLSLALTLLLIHPMPVHAQEDTSSKTKSSTTREILDAQANFHFVTGCITTDAVSGIILETITTKPGGTTENIRFAVIQVRQASEPANGPECADEIIQDSFFTSDDPIGNFHPAVMEVDRSLQSARVAGTASFFDFFHLIQRDMAFDIRWEGFGAVVHSQSFEEFEDNGELVTFRNEFFVRDAVAEGFIQGVRQRIRRAGGWAMHSRRSCQRREHADHAVRPHADQH
jgi:hypothetical protein